MVGVDRIEEESMTAVLSLADPELLARRDLTVDDVADLPEDLRYELVDGRLVLTPAPLPIHQNIGFYVMGALKENCPPDRYLSFDQSILVDSHNERRPDVVVLSAETANRSRIHAEDVFLVVEIISRSSKVIDREEKMKEYAKAGIPAYWIIDPLDEKVTFSRFSLEQDGNYHCRLRTTSRVRIAEPWPVTLDPSAWTSERDWLDGIARPDR